MDTWGSEVIRAQVQGFKALSILICQLQQNKQGWVW